MLPSNSFFNLKFSQPITPPLRKHYISMMDQLRTVCQLPQTRNCQLHRAHFFSLVAVTFQSSYYLFFVHCYILVISTAEFAFVFGRSESEARTLQSLKTSLSYKGLEGAPESLKAFHYYFALIFKI